MVKAMCPVTDRRSPAYVRVSRANIENEWEQWVWDVISTTRKLLLLVTGTHRYILPNCGDVKTTAVLVNAIHASVQSKIFRIKIDLMHG